jgi:hypothetical protein
MAKRLLLAGVLAGAAALVVIAFPSVKREVKMFRM